jgi:hypothetical protein
MADRSSSIAARPDVRPDARPDVRAWPHWPAALLFGLLLLLALLIASWFLRACSPVDPTTNLSTLETPAPPAPPPPVDPTPVLKTALDEARADQKQLQAELATLSAGLKHRLAQCKAAEPKPAPHPSAPPPPAPLPADRWAAKDLGMLQGCWRLGRDTQGNIGLGGRSQTCEVNAGRICFQANGTGQRETSAVCPGTGGIRCTAPITARFGTDNTLGTTQPAVRCTPGVAGWNGPPNSLTCRRVSDTLAVCRDRQNFEYEFRRE